MKLSPHQLLELEKLAAVRKPGESTYGPNRTRTQSALVRLGLVDYSEGRRWFCEITDAGRAALKAASSLTAVQIDILRRATEGTSGYRAGVVRVRFSSTIAAAHKLVKAGLLKALAYHPDSGVMFEITDAGREALK